MIRKESNNMSIRIETNHDIPIHNGETRMEEVTVYATTRTEAAKLSTARFIMGSVLFVIDEGNSFMLDADGTDGTWRSVTDGTPLNGGGDGA